VVLEEKGARSHYAWNLLPENVRNSTAIAIFKRSLKTFLFEQSTFSTLEMIFHIQVYFLIVIQIRNGIFQIALFWWRHTDQWFAISGNLVS